MAAKCGLELDKVLRRHQEKLNVKQKAGGRKLLTAHDNCALIFTLLPDADAQQWIEDCITTTLDPAKMLLYYSTKLNVDAQR